MSLVPLLTVNTSVPDIAGKCTLEKLQDLFAEIVRIQNVLKHVLDEITTTYLVLKAKRDHQLRLNYLASLHKHPLDPSLANPIPYIDILEVGLPPSKMPSLPSEKDQKKWLRKKLREGHDLINTMQTEIDRLSALSCSLAAEVKMLIKIGRFLGRRWSI